MSRFFARYVALSARRTGLLLGLLGLAAIGALLVALRLELHTDFAELLPDNHPAVVALRRISGRQISSTNLVLIIESPDPQANRRLAEALRPELTKLIGTIFTEIQWRPETEVPDYYSRNRWLYASREDLLHAEQLLDRIVGHRRNPLLVDFEGNAEAELKDLRQKLNQKLPARVDTPYFEALDRHDPKLHHLGIMLWRRGDGLASQGDQQTLEALQKVVARFPLASFHPQMKIEYSGAIARALDEHQAVQNDLTVATLVCVTLVLLVIYLYFRRVAVLWVVGAPAVLGVLLALALARLTIHYLNANTAFLISIILGNGINSPIILLARYGEERRRGEDVQGALRIALLATLVATLTATAAASISYGCLLWTSLRGFNQFGVVGGAGMLLVWIMSFLLVPPMVIFGERLRPGVLTPPPNLWRGPFLWLGRLAERRPTVLALVSLGLVCGAAVPAYRHALDPLEYNFSNLLTVQPDSQRRWDIMYDLGLGNVGAGYIGTDGVLLVDWADQADAVADALWQKDQALGDRSVLKAVRTLNTVLPKDQDDKLATLGRIRARIDRNIDLMDDAEAKEVQAWRPPDSLRRLAVPDLPRRLRENFTEVDGTVGRLVGIDAEPAHYNERDGRGLLRLARSLHVDAFGKTWTAASTAGIFAGMLETIVSDGPKVTLAALCGVTLLLVFAFGLRGAVPVLCSLLIGLLWLGGLVGLIRLKLNFLNFVALPITLGVGTDYGANIWARLRTEGVDKLAAVVGDTGSAVALCSMTTIIGYSSLLLASSRALRTFGQMADLGEVTCLLSALVALPAIIRLWQLWRDRPVRYSPEGPGQVSKIHRRPTPVS